MAAAASVLRAPELLRRALLPLLASSDAARLLASGRALREEVQHLEEFQAHRSRQELPIGPAGARGLASAVAGMPALRRLRLDLGYQEMGAAAAGALASAVGRLALLAHLAADLRHNELGDAGLCAWASAVASLPRLESLLLQLGFNWAGREAASALARAVGTLQVLQQLSIDLDISNIGELAASELLLAAGALPALRQLRLDLASAGIRDVGARILADAVTQRFVQRDGAVLAEVRLDLRGNRLGAEGQQRLHKAMGQLAASGCRCTCVM